MRRRRAPAPVPQEPPAQRGRSNAARSDSTSARTSQPSRWSFTSPWACISAYIVVGPTCLKPRPFSAAASRPVAGDDRFFEKVCLEGFQSGLSWRLILHRREAFREAFEGFAIERVARFSDADVERLATNPAIVRNRAKIAAAVHNARRALALRDEVGALDAFFWSFEPPPEERPAAAPTLAPLRANPTSPSSGRLAEALRARGFRHVGPTTMHALMQAHGLVNDHVDGCDFRTEVEAERTAFARPT